MFHPPWEDAPGTNVTLRPTAAPAWLRPALRAGDAVDPSRRVNGAATSAVLVVVTGHTLADAAVILTHRSPSLRSHSGQIAFPGGRVDPEDADVVATALREAREETGLDPDGVEVLGVLPPVPLIVSGHVVHPVIGWWCRPGRVAVVDEAEAAAVFRLPVADLVAPQNRCRVARPGGRRGETPGFLVGERLVWGFTAALLDRLLDLLDWSVPWDRSHVIDAETWEPVSD